ncbi:MAG: GNAT family N-acetyltransferase [Hydrogenophaga sp.]|uniref:GNAT family N-acetyltransferase n=1 Tax=Hydrogenophaga sp. TaxID=1904254 RepID=UPI0016AF6D1D|nr:GNAT family N-acetyltransferase [Hydrogenophaga sp.]NIM44009.1 GNAT family N-acetyltransferase [Hydrogenophaga sp.]NIN29070.1 GNAT family N-acetyltransferase [Hydrogenophaga sp.]NIN33547.1 GNAT family N-acetyltransferase [Hydrogenophaga sp.]NIN58212.1 GNAT family N-acetyltransferase [Hydrogenophaga sp.]NIO54510.1 GNAT family N-acetyltransferase [Hydrogenophaga sp.]
MPHPHPLDRPVWASLSGAHARLSRGSAFARRYLADVNRFAATPDEGPEALAALADLLAPGESVFLLQVPPIELPPGLRAVKRATGVQMEATRDLREQAIGEGIDALGEADAPEMLALATLTEPGPFLARTHAMGDFIGVRRDGRLLAMAGERFRVPGFAEVSGVCTHPDARGLGLARRLSAAVAARIQARGEQPFLHAWETNTAAIRLYETLGFRRRATVNVAVLERAAD